LAASDRKESTRALSANLSRRHLEPPLFGKVPLDKLKPSDVEALVLTMRTKTKPVGEDAEPVRALSDSTIRQVYTVLRAGPLLIRYTNSRSVSKMCEGLASRWIRPASCAASNADAPAPPPIRQTPRRAAGHFTREWSPDLRPSISRMSR
jgi:hypothetical protein